MPSIEYSICGWGCSMTECKPIKIPHRGICAGSLDRRVSILKRDLLAPVTDENFGQGFTLLKKVWAGLKTTQGRASFYSTNTEESVTHIFYVRWFDTITGNLWVNHKGENYDIIEVENIDQRSEFAALYCNVRGDDTKDMNRD